jgi:hypothetical protein
MFLHLVIAAALLAPGTTAATAVRHAAAMVCTLAADTQPAATAAADASVPQLPAPPVRAPQIRAARAYILTTQLRR